jgi:hypothetical protein
MGMTVMKTRSLGIAFAALLAFAPVRGNAREAANTAAPANAATPAADPTERAASVPRPSILSSDETTPRKPRRVAKKNPRRYAYWEPFPMYWPSYHGHLLSWRRLAWFNWF